MQGILENLLGNGLLSEETLRILTGQQAVPQRNKNAPEAPYLMENATPPALNAVQPTGGEMAYPNDASSVPMMVQAMQSGQTGFAPSAGGEMAYPNMGNAAPSEGPGVLSASGGGLNKFAQALNIIGRGLMTAGSENPAATAAEFAKLEHETNKPKVVPLANGAFSMVVAPDGTTKIVKNEDVAKYLSDQSDMKRLFELAKIGYKSDADVNAANRKNAGNEQIKTAGDSAQTGLAVNELEDVAKSLEKTDSATGPVVGLVPKWGRDLITPEGADLQDRAERIIQASLRQTLGAQFTEKEGARFLERAYNPRLDEKTNAARLRQVAKELADIQSNKDAALEYMKKNGTLEGFKAPQSSMPGRESSGSQDFAAQAKSAWGSYDPDQYEYRMNNGVLQRRKK